MVPVTGDDEPRGLSGHVFRQVFGTAELLTQGQVARRSLLSAQKDINDNLDNYPNESDSSSDLRISNGS